MNKEIIPISPVYDKTPYDPPIRTRRNVKRPTRLGLTRIISLLCALNAMTCIVFFFAGMSNAGAYIKGFMIDNLYGGLVGETELKESYNTNTLPKQDSIPTVADPSEEIVDGTSDEAENVLKTFLKLYEFDESLVPEGTYPIIPYDLSSEADGELRLYNDTSMSVDINQYAQAEQTVEGCNLSADPIVLIIHTHGTEAYSEEGVFGYSETYNIPRSYDVTKNVIHIGSVIASVLNDNGVLTIQSDVMHDAESYLGAYERSAETVKDYLERYPTIKYVFDIHRDSVLLEDKTKTRPITVANGEIAAQIMTVAGSNELGAYHPNWEMNLTLAAKLQKELNESHLGLARAICLRGSTYNQELAPYSLLFEVGSCGNSLKEAEVSARILANTIAEIIKNGW